MLLFRSFDGGSAFRLSFLLSIPAAFVAGALAVLDSGVPTIAPSAAVAAIVSSAAVGYLTIGGLLRVVEQLAFWVFVSASERWRCWAGLSSRRDFSLVLMPS